MQETLDIISDLQKAAIPSLKCIKQECLLTVFVDRSMVFGDFFFSTVMLNIQLRAMLSDNPMTQMQSASKARAQIFTTCESTVWNVVTLSSRLGIECLHLLAWLDHQYW